MQEQRDMPPPRRVRRSLVVLLLVLLLAACWQYGLIGSGIRRYVLPRLLPALLESEGISIRRIARDSAPRPLAGRGLHVTTSPAYLLAVLARSPVPASLLPPGLLVDGLTIHADWMDTDDGRVVSLPIVWRFEASVGKLPRVHLQFPAAELNHLLSTEFAEDWSERGVYMLGHYDLDQRIWFHSLRLESIGMPRTNPSDAVEFRATATGRLRYWFKDGIVKARLTADVKELTVLFSFVPVTHADGIGFDYSATVETLDISVDNMAPWLERRVADALAKSMERSQNKRRKKEKMARHRLPAWLPLDINLIVELIETHE